MGNVFTLIGEAPTVTSSVRERNRAEKAGYLIDRGDHLEWHRHRKGALWAWPGPAPAGVPVLAQARLAASAPGPTCQVERQRMRGFVLDGPGLAAQRAGAPPLRLPSDVRRQLALRMIGWVLLFTVLSVLAVLVFVILFFVDGSLPWGSHDGKGRGPHLYLLTPDGSVLAVVSDFDVLAPGRPEILEELYRHGVHVDVSAVRLPGTDGPPPPPPPGTTPVPGNYAPPQQFFPDQPQQYGPQQQYGPR